MTALLWTLLSMAVSGSVLILLLLFLLPRLRRYTSRRWQYYIWLAAVLRLLLPFAPEASLMNQLFSPPAVVSRTDALPQTVSDTVVLPDPADPMRETGTALPEIDPLPEEASGESREPERLPDSAPDQTPAAGTAGLTLPDADRLLWEDADQRVRLYEQYLEPVLTSTALGDNEWDSPGEIPLPLWVFEDLYRHDHDNTSPFDVYGADWPVDEMVSQLSRYFDGVTEELLIGEYQDIYDPASGTLHYEGGRGGGPYCLRVTGWEEDGDRLTLHYEQYSYFTGEPLEGCRYQLTVRLLEDGSFRYLGNHKA